MDTTCQIILPEGLLFKVGTTLCFSTMVLMTSTTSYTATTSLPVNNAKPRNSSIRKSTPNPKGHTDYKQRHWPFKADRFCKEVEGLDNLIVEQEPGKMSDERLITDLRENYRPPSS